MSKRVFFCGVALVLVAVAFLLTDQLLWEPGVTAANVRQLRPGMTMQEVEGILGGLPLYPENEFNLPPAYSPGFGLSFRLWRGKGGTAIVYVNERNQVVWAEFAPGRQAGDLARIRAWLGW